MYYVIIFLALIVVVAVLIVLRTVASYPQRDEAELSETPATNANLAQNTPAVAGEHENASLSEEKFLG